jgi:hypothetical protein
VFGIQGFIRGGYNSSIYRWVMENYVQVGQFGPLPEKSAPFVPYIMWVYERKDAVSSSPAD